MTPTQPDKIRRNLRALFVAGFFLTLLASIGGGVVLVVGHARPDVVQPVWQSGQGTMFHGIVHLFIYLGIFFQVRKLTKGVEASP